MEDCALALSVPGKEHQVKPEYCRDTEMDNAMFDTTPSPRKLRDEA